MGAASRAAEGGHPIERNGESLPLSGSSERWRLVFPLAFGLFFLVLALPLIQGKVYVENDLGMYHLPTRWYLARCLERGESPFWWSQAANGMYLHGEGQAGLLHPVHGLLYRALPFEVAFNLELLMPYVLCLFGSFLFARRRLSAPSAWFHAWALTGSSFFLLHFSHTNMVAVLAHLPWMLWLIEGLYEATTTRTLCGHWSGLTVALASQLLLGHPPAVVISAVLLGAWVLVTMPFWERKGRTGLLVLALLAGALLGAAQVLPTIAEASRSARNDWSPEQRLMGSLHPLNLAQWFAPYLFADRVYAEPRWGELSTLEGGFYPGSVTLVLAALGLSAGHGAVGECRRMTRAWLILGLCCLILAWGAYGGLYGLLANVPPFDRMRIPARFMVGVMFALAGLAALGFERLQAREPFEQGPSRAERIAVGVLVALAWLPAIGVLAAGRALRGPVVLGGVLFSLAAWLAFAAFRKARWALALLVLLAVADQGCYGLSAVGTHPPPLSVAEFLETQPIAPPVPPEPEGTGVYIADYLGNPFTMLGYRVVCAYAALLPRQALDYSSEQAQRVAGVRWNGVMGGTAEKPVLKWHAVREPMPRVRLLAEARVSRDPGRDLMDIDIERVGLVSEPIDLGDGAPGSCRLVEDRPGRIAIRYIAATTQLLVVTESHHEGWTATVDDSVVRIQRVYGDLLGCVVPPGEHAVVLEFDPGSLRWGLGLTLAGFVLAAVTLAALWVTGKSPAGSCTGCAKGPTH